MLEINYFFRENDYNILGSITNKQAREYVYFDGEYLPVKVSENPFVLLTFDVGSVDPNHVDANTKRRHFAMPVVFDGNQFVQLEFSEYIYRKENGGSYQYIFVSSEDRLRFSAWIKNGRNTRFCVYEYANQMIYSKRVQDVKKLSLSLMPVVA